MPLLQIRDVPERTRQVLTSRAAARGESLNSLLLALLAREAEQPTVAEVLARAAARSERVTASSVDEIRAARREHQAG